MDIETWWSTSPSQLVNEIAQEKRYIGFAIHDPKALSFKNQEHLIKDILTMSRKVKNGRQQAETPVVTGKSTAGVQGKSGKSTRWARCDVRTREAKDAVRELAANVNFILDTIVELVDDGYDLHVKRTDAGSTVRAMLFCSIPNHVNVGGGLSAEAPDAWLALSCLVYKHATVLQGEWFDEGNEFEEDDHWR